MFALKAFILFFFFEDIYSIIVGISLDLLGQWLVSLMMTIKDFELLEEWGKKRSPLLPSVYLLKIHKHKLPALTFDVMKGRTHVSIRSEEWREGLLNLKFPSGTVPLSCFKLFMANEVDQSFFKSSNPAITP